MTNIGKGIIITGTIHAEEDVMIAGTVNGEVLAHNHDVTLEPGGRVEGGTTARSVTVRGTFVPTEMEKSARSMRPTRSSLVCCLIFVRCSVLTVTLADGAEPVVSLRAPAAGRSRVPSVDCRGLWPSRSRCVVWPV